MAAGQGIAVFALSWHRGAAAAAALGLVGLFLPPQCPGFFAGAQGGGAVALGPGGAGRAHRHERIAPPCWAGL